MGADRRARKRRKVRKRRGGGPVYYGFRQLFADKRILFGRGSLFDIIFEIEVQLRGIAVEFLDGVSIYRFAGLDDRGGKRCQLF